MEPTTNGERKKVVIAGAGGIGSAVGLLLRELGDFPVDVYIGDMNPQQAENAAEWIAHDSSISGLVVPFTLPEQGSDSHVNDIMKGTHIILDCLPGSQAPRIARFAREHGSHYTNLTEYVTETEEIQTQIAPGASTGFLLQTGLAPGFINVLANGLFQQFCAKYGVDRADTVTMKVGALTQSAVAPHFYGFTWSPIGVATEYVEPAIVLRDGKKTVLPSLTERANVVIQGVAYEEDLTSGGAADLPDALEGRVRSLDYKTLRYPGHYAWVEGLLRTATYEDRSGRALCSIAERLQECMERAVPRVEDDVVVIYASVEGRDSEGHQRLVDKSYAVRPTIVGGKPLRAIQSTTAAGLAESARLLLSGEYKGVVLQSQINPQQFLNGPFVLQIYR